MPEKPSSNEAEYFARLEVERRRKFAEERDAKIAEEERARARELHFMKCPKCGSPLEEFALDNVHVDKCLSCEGLWLDAGELETIRGKDAGFMGQLMNVFRK
ncbi:MAG: zf-TFIIB domain-containing protein [bacterium]